MADPFEVQLSATPALVNAGATFLLAWSITRGLLPMTASINQGIGAVAASTGSQTVTISKATNYTITVTDRGGNVRTSTISVGVMADMGTVTPDILSVGVTNFVSGANLPAATYRVDYVSGAMGYDSTSQFWTVNSPLNPNNGYSITDSASNVVKTSQGGAFLSTEAAVWAREAGTSNTYVHVGGKPIGIAFFDNPLATNKSGTPNPTWRLFGPFYPIQGDITADSQNIIAGQSTTVRWTSTNADVVTINGAGSALSGSMSVSPLTTTAYTEAMTAANALTETRAVTVTVSPLPAPSNLTATGLCGSTIALEWQPVALATSYNVLRGTLPGGPYTMIGGTVVPTFLIDTPTGGFPLPWITYYYVVQANLGAATSANSAEASAYAFDVVGVPYGLLATAYAGYVALSWTAVPHATAYKVYSGPSSGGEVYAATVGNALFIDNSAGGTIWYKVSSVGPCGESALSAEISVTAQTVTPCSVIEETGAAANSFADLVDRVSTIGSASVEASTSSTLPGRKSTWG